MKPFLIKVCGMRDADNIRQVEALTPDMMGFICWEGSRRHVSRLPDYLPETCRRVGVFVNPEIGYIQERIKTFRLDLVQLHGHETPEFCRSIKEEGLKSGHALQIIKAFGVAPGEPFPRTEDYEADCDFFLFDTRGPTAGGSGRTFDWDVLQNYHGHTPFFLSGGIGPDSTDRLRSFSHPAWAGVDLNSRFETATAQKDVGRLSDFIKDLRGQNISEN